MGSSSNRQFLLELLRSRVGDQKESGIVFCALSLSCCGNAGHSNSDCDGREIFIRTEKDTR